MTVDIETLDGQHLIREPSPPDSESSRGRIFGAIVAHTGAPFGPGWRIHFVDGTVGAETWYSFDAAMVAAQAYYTDHLVRERALREAGPLSTAPDIWPINEDPQNPEY